jgi:hypothetical protein
VQRAARAAEHAVTVFVIERTTVRSFRARLTQHGVLVCCQELSPLGVGDGTVRIWPRRPRPLGARVYRDHRQHRHTADGEDPPSRHIHSTNTYGRQPDPARSP